MHLSNLSPVRVLGASLGLVLALAATVAQAHDIKVCKESDSTSPVPAGTSFSFTLDDDPATFALTVGGMCLQFAGVGVGEHVITEDANPGTVVSAIMVSPSGRLVSFDLALRTVTVEAVDEPPPTTVTFVNKLQPPCDSLCQTCRATFCPPFGGGNSAAAHWCQTHYTDCGFNNVGQCVSDAAHNDFRPSCCTGFCVP
jgi:hypothetical protein